MAIRDYAFITGPETSTLPTATSPTATTDIATKGYIDGYLGTVGVAPNTASNYSLAASVSGGDLTIALKTQAGTDPTANDSVSASFRSATITTGTYTTVTQTSALSLTILEEQNLRHASVENPVKLWVYLVNNGGTLSLAASNFGYNDALLGTVIQAQQTFTATATNPGVCTCTSHGLENGDMVYISTTGTVPTNLAANVPLYVTNVTANTFELHTEAGRANGIQFLSAGTGTLSVYPISPRLFGAASLSSVPFRLIGTVAATHSNVGSGGWSAVNGVSSHVSRSELAGQIFAKWKKTSGNHATSGSSLAMDFASATVRDTHGAVDQGTARLYITIPGRYQIDACVSFDANATGVRYATLYNGYSVTETFAISALVSGNASLAQSCPMSVTKNFVKGDVIFLSSYQNSGGALNYNSAASSVLTYCSMQLIQSDV